MNTVMKNYKPGRDRKCTFAGEAKCIVLYQQQQVKEAKEQGIELEHNGDEFAVNISWFGNLQTLLSIDVIVKNLIVYLFGRQI